MKRFFEALVFGLAVTGALTLLVDGSTALKKHYETKCVDDNADDYGFTIPQIKASAFPASSVYGEHL